MNTNTVINQAVSNVINEQSIRDNPVLSRVLGILDQAIEDDPVLSGVLRILKLGLDLHYRQVTVAMQEDGGRIKAVGKMSYELFLDWIQKKLEEGWQIYSCYEAGASGYWLHRQLEQMRVRNLVVVPKVMDPWGKKQKTDKRDSGQLCDCLDRYLRGQDKALSIVAVPSLEQEEKRGLIRYHRQIMADRGRFESRGKGLLCAQGIQVDGPWWQLKGWLELQRDPRLKDWMKEQLLGWRNKILSAEKEQNLLRERIEALAPAILPKGLGAYSWVVLEYEMRGFGRFKNRRQVASMTGLCPGVHLSDGRGKEGSINRCGIGIVRWTLVEAVWRLMIWQPQYPPVRRLAAGLVKSKRAKKRLVVQAARRLAIDLWRLATGQTTPEKLGLVMQVNPPEKVKASRSTKKGL
jgi:transposase